MGHKEIKKINSQEIPPGLAGADTSMNRLNSPIRQTSEASEDCKPDTNTQNIHTGGAQSTGGLTGGEVKSEETYNGVNSQKPVICKPEPLCPPANNQNLKGCGKRFENLIQSVVLGKFNPDEMLKRIDTLSDITFQGFRMMEKELRDIKNNQKEGNVVLLRIP